MRSGLIVGTSQLLFVPAAKNRALTKPPPDTLKFFPRLHLILLTNITAAAIATAMSSAPPVFVAVVGVGGVGKAFLAQWEPLRHTLTKQAPAVDLRLLAARRSSHQVISHDYSGLNASDVLSQMNEANNTPTQLMDFLVQAPGPVVLVDNTSDLDWARSYPDILSRGVSIVTPNKKAFSDTDDLWRRIFAAARNGPSGPSTGGYIFHEATVGAGLPVLSTLRDLLDTGDRVTRIEGVFSGTMSFLFNSFQPLSADAEAMPFSAAVARARDLGYTEPDPRDDLNGLDVARKLTILARLAGVSVDGPTAFPVESLVPSALSSCPDASTFLTRLPDHDAEMDRRRAAATAKGAVVRFVGSIDVASRALRVGLDELAPAHPIAGLQGTDNLIAFHTERYGARPLVVQGAGAGAAVTAMGVAADMIRVVRLLQRSS